MDFSEIAIPDILENGMANRFQDFPPSDFEDFIAQLFKDNHYEVTQTAYSGDYGADLIISKDGKSTAVQVKRYSTLSRVGVKEINQVLGAKDYYKCEHAMVITTSSFTKPGRELGSKTQTELWNWNRLQKFVCDTYLDGKDYYAYFGNRSNANSYQKLFGFEVTRVRYDQQMKGGVSYTLIHATMKNQTQKNISLDLIPPIFITRYNKQVEANYWYEGYFTKGTIYAGCSVEISFMFKTEQLPRVKNGDRIIFRWTEDGFEVVTEEYNLTQDYAHPFDQRAPTASDNSSCYIVTMCCGRDSLEYVEMIYFRDNSLRKVCLGKLLTDAYYRYGYSLASKLKGSLRVKKVSIFLLKAILIPVVIYNNRSRSQNVRLRLN